jgi:hypothetical protein
MSINTTAGNIFNELVKFYHTGGADSVHDVVQTDSYCRKYRKTIDPKCDDKPGCHWIPCQGCRSTGSSVTQATVTKPKAKKKHKVKVNRGNIPNGYIEPQVDLHCAKHALNHVFQQDLVVVDMEQPDERIVEGKYNIHWYCINNYLDITGTDRGRFLELSMEEQLALVDNRAPATVSDATEQYTDLSIAGLRSRCQQRGINHKGKRHNLVERLVDTDLSEGSLDLCDANGDYNIDSINQILSDMRFRRNNYDDGQPGGIPWDTVQQDLETPRCLGLILLIGEGGEHYTAVSTTVRDCWVYGERGELLEKHLAYIDSIGRLWMCKNIPDMKGYLSSQSKPFVQSVISVFKTDDSIPCVASEDVEMAPVARY